MTSPRFALGVLCFIALGFGALDARATPARVREGKLGTTRYKLTRSTADKPLFGVPGHRVEVLRADGTKVKRDALEADLVAGYRLQSTHMIEATRVISKTQTVTAPKVDGKPAEEHHTEWDNVEHQVDNPARTRRLAEK